MAKQIAVKFNLFSPLDQSLFHKTKPFPHLIIPNFLDPATAKKLSKELLNELFEEKKADLFHFYQTKDLISSDNKFIQEFRQALLSSELINALQQITGKKLSSKNIDLFGSLYQDTHFLLPHDDQLEGRAIAFMIYLSDLSEEDGGACALYDSKNNQPTTITKRIIPKFNDFVFFEVSTKSFHEVEEVVGKSQRLAVSGWFLHA